MSGDQAVDEDIRLRAYYLWEANGRPADRDEEFWRRACEMTAANTDLPICTTQSKRKKATRPAQPRRTGIRRISPLTSTEVYPPPG